MKVDIGDDEYIICITKPNYKPYVVRWHKSIRYIQDETISEDLNIIADDIVVGSHVTTTKPSGPVTITSGIVNLKGYNGVTIMNDFEVQSGTILNIQTR